MLRDASYAACAANADAQVAPLDQLVAQLGPWRPSNYWDPETLRAIVTKAQQLLSGAYDAIAQAIQSCIHNVACPANNINLLNSNKDQLDDVTTQSQNYLAAIDAAETSAAAAIKTVYILAPGVKTWAEDSLVRVSAAMHAASVVSCMEPWWASAWTGLVAIANDYVAFVTSALGVAESTAKTAIAAGQAAFAVAKESLGIIYWVTQNVWTIAGVLALAAGGIAAYKHRDQLRALVSKRT